MSNTSRHQALTLTAVAYGIAGAAAVLVGFVVRSWHPIAVAAAADLAATAVVFAFSVRLNNSSMYDPYWSVAPVPMAAYWALHDGAAGAPMLRQLLVIGLVSLWAARLTFNCFRRWQGLGHEDWRYAQMRPRAGRAYWLVSWLGFHLMPTVVVFLACLPLYAALHAGRQPVGWLDGLAVAVVLLGIVIETVADEQLHRFIVSKPAAGTLLTRGLWASCRHPNYLGEILFWWGVLLMGLAAAPGSPWMVVGALAMTALFVGISIPMIDRRMAERRPGYRARMRQVRALIPGWPR